MDYMLQWLFYPQNKRIPKHLEDVINEFQDQYEKIKSPINNFKSNEVLDYIRSGLEKLGFEVEKGKKKSETIEVPVLFGRNGELLKYFQVDAYAAGSSRE